MKTQGTDNMPTHKPHQWKNEPGYNVPKISSKQIKSTADFALMRNKPTTLRGYGITDALKLGENQNDSGIKNFTNGIQMGDTSIIKMRWNSGNLQIHDGTSWRNITIT